MNKSILISIRPEWVKKILNGKKTIEIRKTMPKCDLPIDVYIYCTKDNGKNNFNGKVVAKFTLNKIEMFAVYFPYLKSYFKDIRKKLQHIIDSSCLSLKEMYEYAPYKNLYAWHVDNLEIFDKSLELHNFTTYCDGENDKKCKKCPYYWYESNESIGFEDGCCCNHKPPLSKAPQSWCYVYRKEDK